jgi:hypothetical protein
MMEVGGAHNLLRHVDFYSLDVSHGVPATC